MAQFIQKNVSVDKPQRGGGRYAVIYCILLFFLLVLVLGYEKHPKSRQIKENVWALNIRHYSELVAELSARMHRQLDREPPEPGLVSVEPPLVIPASSTFEGRIEVSIRSEDGARVFFSLDGSVPTPGHQRAGDTITITETAVLKAKAFDARGNFSDTVTASYVSGPKGKFPTVSLAMDPVHLINKDVGILANPLQRGRAWERPGRFAVFLPDTGEPIEFDGAVRIHGSASRTNPRKSLRLYVDSESSDLQSLFHDNAKPISPAQSEWILRYAGNNHQLHRDRLGRQIARQLNLIVGDEVSCVLYVNGELWGVYDLMERVNEQFLVGKIGEGSYLLRNGGLYRPRKSGNSPTLEKSSDWKSVYEFIANSEQIDPDAYEWIKGHIQIDEFVDYIILLIFSGDIDRPHRNMDLFRSTEQGSKWRFVVWDLDGAFNYRGLYTYHDTLAWYLRDRPMQELQLTGSPDSWNKVRSTIVLRRLLENDQFRKKFLNRFETLLNTKLASDNLLELFDNMLSDHSNVEYIERARFSGKLMDSEATTYEEQLSQIREFLIKRPALIHQYLQKNIR